MDTVEFTKGPSSGPHTRPRLGGRSQSVPCRAQLGGGSPGEWLNVPNLPPDPPAEKPQLTVSATHKAGSCGPGHPSRHSTCHTEEWQAPREGS